MPLPFLDVNKVIKKETLKIDLNKNKIPDAYEVLDCVEAACDRAHAAAQAIEPYLNMLDAEDVVSVLTLLNRRGKFTPEQIQDFAVKGIEYLHATSDLGDIALQVKAAAEGIEKELKS
jgi:hypothetical protein